MKITTPLLRYGLLALALVGMAACSHTKHGSSLPPARGVANIPLPLIVTNDITGDYRVPGGGIKTMGSIKPGDVHRLSLRLPDAAPDSSVDDVKLTAYWASVAPASGKYQLVRDDWTETDEFDGTDSTFFRGYKNVGTISKSGWTHVYFKFDPEEAPDTRKLLVICAYGTKSVSPNVHVYSGAQTYTFVP